MDSRLIAQVQTDLASNIIEAKSRDELLEYITKAIDKLLHENFEKLLSIMYRLDVDENKFKMALSNENPSIAISTLVLLREEQRLKLRDKYSN